MYASDIFRMVRRCLSPVTIKKQADSLIVIAEKDVFRQFLTKNDSYNQNSTGFFDCELRKSSTGTAAGKYEGQATQSMLHPKDVPLAAKVCWSICLNTPATQNKLRTQPQPAAQNKLRSSAQGQLRLKKTKIVLPDI